MVTFTKTDIKKANQFLETEGKRIVYFHRDADGVTSAALLLRAFQNLDCRGRETPVLDEDFFMEMEWERPELLVFLDLPVDQSWRIVERVSRRNPEARILIIDHHTVEKNLNSKNILHINPRFKNKDKYLPTAFLVYKILESMKIKMDKYCWIAGIGVIGDYAFKECKTFLNKCAKNHPFLGRAEELVSGAITLKKMSGADRVLEYLTESKSYREFMQKQQLRKWRNVVDKEFSKTVTRSENRKDEYPELKLIIYPVKSKIGMLSHVSTHFSEKTPNSVVLAVKETGHDFKISIRCQSGRINVAELVKNASKGLGSAGGHPKAAGGMVKNFNLFKKRIIRKLKEE